VNQVIMHPFNEALAANLQELEGNTEISEEGKQDVIMRAFSQLWMFPGSGKIMNDMEVAVAQGVEFATYVREHAKGKMVGAAEHFLSLKFSRELEARMESLRAYERSKVKGET
jgi:hypothetical protein